MGTPMALESQSPTETLPLLILFDYSFSTSCLMGFLYPDLVETAHVTDLFVFPFAP